MSTPPTLATPLKVGVGAGESVPGVTAFDAALVFVTDEYPDRLPFTETVIFLPSCDEVSTKELDVAVRIDLPEAFH